MAALVQAIPAGAEGGNAPRVQWRAPVAWRCCAAAHRLARRLADSLDLDCFAMLPL
jgi:hypothetical protein